MAQNIFDTYGIKQVADVQFEALADDTRLGVEKGDIVLYLDTLKVSTIETTAEQTEATGGKGNVPLIIWDYGREITLTLEDALFTPASLAVMMGGQGVVPVDGTPVTVRYTEDVVAGASGAMKAAKAASGATVHWINLTAGTRGKGTVGAENAITATTGAPSEGDKVKLFYDVDVASDDATKAAYEITIDAKNFPGTYKVYGDTLVRSQADGSDTPFQFVIPKAKINSEVTFTMEAEGDPTTFEMTLRVLRGDDGEMIKLIKYNLDVKANSDSTSDT